MPSGKQTWLFKMDMEIVDSPIEHGDLNHSYVIVCESWGMSLHIPQLVCDWETLGRALSRSSFHRDYEYPKFAPN